MGSTLQLIRQQLSLLVREHDLGAEAIEITARPLSPDEAIGRTSRKDFPLVVGRERLIEAQLQAARGHAYTDMPADYRSSLGELLELDLSDNARRAFFVAAANAVCRHLFDDLRTVHCRNHDPERCGPWVAQELLRRFGRVRVGVIGLNPAIVEAVSDTFGPDMVQVTDLDAAKVGTGLAGVRVCDARRETGALVGRSDIVLATGTTIANGTSDMITALAENHGKPLLLYGVTCASAAQLLGYERLCPYAS